MTTETPRKIDRLLEKSASPSKEASDVRLRAETRASAPRVKVAYVMSHFPKLTETFILFEMLALERLGAEVEVFPLLRARNSTTHPEGAGPWTKAKELLRQPASEAVMHPEAEEFVARAHFAPLISPAILAAQVHYLVRRPIRYLLTLWTLIRANWGSANFLLGGLAIFPKAVYFARRMQQLNVTHVHAHFANHPAAAGYIINRLSGVPFSFTAHGADLQVDQHMLREKVMAAKFVVSISHDNQHLIERVCGARAGQRVKIVRCGVDTHIFRADDRSSRARRPWILQLVCTGTLYEVKGQGFLIDACRVLKERGVPCECHFLGDGPMLGQLRRRAEMAGLGSSVLFHGRQTRRQVADRLRASDILVAPSVPTAEGRREGIPVVLMEVMASGLPVVASDISGIPELVEHEQTGMLVPARDTRALADVLERLAQDDKFRQRLGEAGRVKILNEFNVERNVEHLLGLFSETNEL